MATALSLKLPCLTYGVHSSTVTVIRELNTACEQLLFVLNQIAALQALTTAPNKADVARTAIVAWYYGVYSAASAMTAAMDGLFQNNAWAL